MEFFVIICRYVPLKYKIEIYILIFKFITENIKLLNVIDNKKKITYD